MNLLDTPRSESPSIGFDTGSTRRTAAPASGARARSAPRLNSEALFGAGQEIEIAHGPAVYRLRITSLGKLILTK